jgi:hypothetical protein
MVQSAKQFWIYFDSTDLIPRINYCWLSYFLLSTHYDLNFNC